MPKSRRKSGQNFFEHHVGTNTINGVEEKSPFEF